MGLTTLELVVTVVIAVLILVSGLALWLVGRGK
jgi:hypothetical protein